MDRSADAFPVGLLLAFGGVIAIAIAGQRAYVAETIDPLFVLALTPVFIAGGVLLTLGFRVRSLPFETGRILKWTVVAAIIMGVTADAVLLRSRAFGEPLDPLLVILAVVSVGAAGAAVAAFIDTRRRNTVSDLQPRLARAEGMLTQASGFLVARLNPEGYIDEWSQGAEQLTGYSADEVIGTHLEMLYPDDAENEPKHHLQRALRTTHVDVNGEFNHASGGSFFGTGTLTAVEHDSGLLGYLLILADHTEEQAHRKNLERRNEQLEAFASVVSHDLRNPLNVAIGNIGMARQLDDNEDKLKSTEEALERMEQLIEDVLTLARQGRDVEEFDRVDLEETVQLAWSSVDEMWAELSYDDLPAVAADGERLRRLFENIFRNAIEHGGEDVAITVGMLADTEGFYIEDDGPGIPTHKHDDVFDAGFTTGDEGTGLGLPIVQSIAEAHGWKITVTDGQSGGARFEITGIQVLAKVD